MTKQVELKTADEIAKPKSLAEKLCLIAGAATAIVKGGTNTFQNYKYVKESDVSDSMRTLLSKHGVFCLPSVEEITDREYETIKNNDKKVTHFIRVKVKYTFINAENPTETYETYHYGDASDTSDKAIYKALTGCHKYALMRTFCLGSDDDPETGGDERNSQTAKQPTPTKGAPAAEGEYGYKIPFEEKDAWKGALRAAGYRWDGASKTWRGTQPIPGLLKYQVVGPQPEDVDAHYSEDGDPGPEYV